MIVTLEELDSLALGKNVLRLSEPEAVSDFKIFEKNYLAKYAPYYVYVKIPAESLALIHFFENQGFRFVEFQLRMTRRLSKKYDTSMSDGIFSIKKVAPDEDIEPILSLADEIFNIDRIYLDPQIGADAAKKRYRLYIKKSWQSPNECLLKSFNIKDGGLVSLNTYLKTGPESVLNLLGGCSPQYRLSGAPIMLERLLLNHWIDEGIKSVTTHISLSNYKIMESEYKAFDFKAQQAFAVLRKIYSDPA